MANDTVSLIGKNFCCITLPFVILWGQSRLTFWILEVVRIIGVITYLCHGCRVWNTVVYFLAKNSWGAPTKIPLHWTVTQDMLPSFTPKGRKAKIPQPCGRQMQSCFQGSRTLCTVHTMLPGGTGNLLCCLWQRLSWYGCAPALESYVPALSKLIGDVALH